MRTRSGFTLVEMLVVAPIIILAIGAFIAVIVSLSGEVLATRAKTLLAHTIQSSLSSIESDIKRSTAFLATNSITPLTSPQGYNDATEGFTFNDSAKGPMLILEQNATLANPLTAPSDFVYQKDEPYSCSDPLIRKNDPLKVNIVYFVKNSSLWRRTILQGDYASTSVSCNPPWQQPSCQVAVGGFCKAEDVELIKGVSTNDFRIEYFTSPDTTPTTEPSSIEDITGARVTLHAEQTAAGRSISWQSSVYASLR